MRACSGTWIAHGSGNADREAVDAHDRLPVPPGAAELHAAPASGSREEEEQGYYYGFANEGLWPLCHVAHVRPVFRESDWHAYRKVNQRFADAVVAEARSEDPDRAGAGLSLRAAAGDGQERLPEATILTFWHIPWPNPESFGICPWRRGDPRRPARQHASSASTPATTATISSRRSTATSRRASSTSIRLIAFGGSETLVEQLPDLDRLAVAGGRGARGRRSSNAAATCSRDSGCRTGSGWPSASTASTTPRASSSACTRSSACSRSIRSGSVGSRCCRSRRRRAARSRSTAASRNGSRASATRINAALRHDRLRRR